MAAAANVRISLCDKPGPEGATVILQTWIKTPKQGICLSKFLRLKTRNCPIAHLLMPYFNYHIYSSAKVLHYILQLLDTFPVPNTKDLKKNPALRRV